MDYSKLLKQNQIKEILKGISQNKDNNIDVINTNEINIWTEKIPLKW